MVIYFIVVIFNLVLMIRKKQFFSPFFIYTSIWFLSVLLLPFFSSVMNYEITDFTINFLIFHSIFGLIIYSIQNRKKTFSDFPPQRISDSYIKWVRRLIILSFFITVSFAISILSRYLDLLLYNPWKLRSMYFEEGIKVFPSLSYTIMLLYATAILGSSVVYFKKENNSKLFYLPLLSAIIFAVVYVGRNEFLKVSIIYFMAILFRNNKIFFLKSLKKIALILGVILVISSLLNKGGELTRNSSSTFEKTMVNISSYGSGSLLAFDIFVNRNRKQEFGYGEYTFYPIFRRLASFGMYKENFEISYITDYESFINTFTYLRPFYNDFGTFGVYLLSSLFLVIIIYFTQINSKPKKLKTYYIYISLFPAVLFSIQGLEYQTMEFFTALVIAYLTNFLNNLKFQ